MEKEKGTSSEKEASDSSKPQSGGTYREPDIDPFEMTGSEKPKNRSFDDFEF